MLEIQTQRKYGWILRWKNFLNFRISTATLKVLIYVFIASTLKVFSTSFHVCKIMFLSSFFLQMIFILKFYLLFAH